ncbi:ACR3 family arsenite efflux transporter [Persicimonas caeni]|uniref:ACR3 family arsenite efflux transporter n=1 Tax=Persicimonas caeni TaxID=2292766 RepID=A0A4Y6PV31_PERCE|nr:ACR3 family arsenite efflux transporter [Persicimonas caeni]QDG52201.1 ACR3 family arsenite efflux transporter [Persicimonas caeni]QED33423.1 ACR3 family arsenite efflux transporter [Persicimonas caeni]
MTSRDVEYDNLIEGANKDIGFFERYLTVWVALCIAAGIAIGQFVPFVPDVLGELTYAEVNLPIAVLIWVMIFPMMLQVDFKSVVGVKNEPRGLTITLVANWLIKPFSMFAIAWLFFNVVFEPYITPELRGEYLAGAVLLGAAPCTAMVFVWSYLTRGDAAYTLVQVAINDLIMLFAFAPIVMFLLGLGDIFVPWETVLLSVVLYVVIPLVAGYATRTALINKKGKAWFDEQFLPKFGPVTMIGLLATLVLLFSFQGEVILDNPLHIVLIAIPLILQTFFIFALAYGWAKAWKVRHCIAAPAALIGSSNFFELAVAAAIVLFGIHSGAALVTVVGVLVEVPLMLALVRIANGTKSYFPQ